MNPRAKIRGRLQKRDMAILVLLGLVVIADRDLIQERLFPDDKTGKSCLRRLRFLRALGVIGKLSFPVVSLTEEPGYLITLYRMTKAGADLLAEATGVCPKRLLRTDPRPQTLLHRRDLARVMVAVNESAKLAKLPEPEWILEQDQRPGVSKKAARADRFILYEDFKQDDDEIVTLRPDASSWLRFPGQTSDGQTTWHDLLIWWEIDRATEGLAQVASKLAGFHILLRQEEPNGNARKLYRRHWPLVEKATTRVFFVCPSLERVRTIASAIRQLPGAEFVRFATIDALTPERCLRDAIWQDVTGSCKAIYPSADSSR